MSENYGNVNSINLINNNTNTNNNNNNNNNFGFNCNQCQHRKLNQTEQDWVISQYPNLLSDINVNISNRIQFVTNLKDFLHILIQFWNDNTVTTNKDNNNNNNNNKNKNKSNDCWMDLNEIYNILHNECQVIIYDIPAIRREDLFLKLAPTICILISLYRSQVNIANQFWENIHNSKIQTIDNINDIMKLLHLDFNKFNNYFIIHNITNTDHILHALKLYELKKINKKNMKKQLSNVNHNTYNRSNSSNSNSSSNEQTQQQQLNENNSNESNIYSRSFANKVMLKMMGPCARFHAFLEILKMFKDPMHLLQQAYEYVQTPNHNNNDTNNNNNNSNVNIIENNDITYSNQSYNNNNNKYTHL